MIDRHFEELDLKVLTGKPELARHALADVRLRGELGLGIKQDGDWGNIGAQSLYGGGRRRGVNDAPVINAPLRMSQLPYWQGASGPRLSPSDQSITNPIE